MTKKENFFIEIPLKILYIDRQSENFESFRELTNSYFLKQNNMKYELCYKDSFTESSTELKKVRGKFDNILINVNMFSSDKNYAFNFIEEIKQCYPLINIYYFGKILDDVLTAKNFLKYGNHIQTNYITHEALNNVVNNCSHNIINTIHKMSEKIQEFLDFTKTQATPEELVNSIMRSNISLLEISSRKFSNNDFLKFIHYEIEVAKGAIIFLDLKKNESTINFKNIETILGFKKNLAGPHDENVLITGTFNISDLLHRLKEEFDNGLLVINHISSSAKMNSSSFFNSQTKTVIQVDSSDEQDTETFLNNLADYKYVKFYLKD